MIELQKLLNRDSTSELNCFWLKDLFQVALEQLRDSLKIIRGTASRGNMLLSDGPPYGVKSIENQSHRVTCHYGNYRGKEERKNNNKIEDLHVGGYVVGLGGPYLVGIGKICWK